MSRILAIDYGFKRTGLAITDPLQIIASGLTTVNTPELLSYLTKLIPSEDIQTVVVGLPKQMDGSPSQSFEMIEEFIQKFKTQFPGVQIVRIDERFTSKIASRTLVDSGLKKKKRQEKGLIDEVAATILLQDYLANHR